MLTEQQWETTATQLRLTRREKEVCKELFDGYTRNEIADHLGIKPRTVRHYMEHIHQKLAVSNRVGVVLRLIQIRDRISGLSPEITIANQANQEKQCENSTPDLNR
jgi:DNA-binding CsgD family transcriptional regulator